MRVLLLGGAGDMALEALRELAREEDCVQSVTVADLNEAKAEAACQEAGLSERGQVTVHDLTDAAWLRKAMQAHDVTLGFAGPFYRLERPLAEVSLDAGKPYVSIADDYDAYLSVWELEGKAKDAGVKILTGWGNSPGITQMLAREGYNQLSHPRKVHVQWAGGSNEDVGATNLMHLFHIFNGTALQTVEGREQPLPAGKAMKRVVFPEPVGELPVYTTGHAESVTLPRNLEGLEEATVHGGVHPPYIAKLAKLLSALGLFKNHQRRVLLARFFHKIEGVFAAGGADKSVGRVDVYDESGDRFIGTYVGHIARLTALPAVQAALWLHEGRFDEKPGGVYSPERLLEDPVPFLDALIEKGVDIRRERAT